MKHNKNLIINMITLWISVTAFVCAILNVHVVRNLLNAEDTSEKKGNGEETRI